MKKISIFLCFAVIFASFFGNSVFAATPLEIEGYPTFSGEYGLEEYVVLVDSSDITWLYRFVSTNSSNSPLVSFVDLENTDGTHTVVAKSNYSGSGYRYKLVDNAWSLQSGGPGNFSANQDMTINNKVASYIYSSYPVYSASDGSLVFPVPPALTPTLEEVILEGVTNLQTETLGTMKILTACGIGLLALLVGLVILPKVLYRFL